MDQIMVSRDINENVAALKKELGVDISFDVVYRTIRVGEREAAIFFIDGFCKDELMQKLLQYFMDITQKDMPKCPPADARPLNIIPHPIPQTIPPIIQEVR